MSLYSLIIFDYSGTLSPRAPLFAAPETLMRELTVSGLIEFGVDSPQIFWDILINPTWMAGSTTSIGYKKMLYERIRMSLKPDLSGSRNTRLGEAVTAFTDLYFSYSHIDPLWAPILRRIEGSPSIMAIIATDHYAEATGYILKYLNDFKICAEAAITLHPSFDKTFFIVANSADLGVHKTDRRFWEILKTRLQLNSVRDILLIDDFGYNEQGQDLYSDRQEVETRMKQTAFTLESVFSAPIQIVPVMIGPDLDAWNARCENAIRKATLTINAHLNANRVLDKDQL